MRRWLIVLFVALGSALGTYLLTRRAGPSLPTSATVLQSVREVARLETLDVHLYKKVQFKPDPPVSDSLVGELWNWARYNVRPPEGRAIVFGTAHLGLDMNKLDSTSLRVDGSEVWMVLPAVVSTVELMPAETEVIASTLDSQQTTALLGLAKEAMERDISADKAMQDRARKSAERALRALLLSLGFTKVYFVEVLPSPISG